VSVELLQFAAQSGQAYDVGASLGEHPEFSLGPIGHGPHDGQEIEKQLFIDGVVDAVDNDGYQFPQRSVTGVNGISTLHLLDSKRGHRRATITAVR
jgi:hypothetical protein